MNQKPKKIFKRI